MEGSPGGLRKQLEEREAQVRDLRDQLDQAQNEIDRLRQENEQLRKELKASGRGRTGGKSKCKGKRKRPGGKADLRSATITQCPCCGGELRWERTDEVTVTDMPAPHDPHVYLSYAQT